MAWCRCDTRCPEKRSNREMDFFQDIDNYLQVLSAVTMITRSSQRHVRQTEPRTPSKHYGKQSTHSAAQRTAQWSLARMTKMNFCAFSTKI